MQQLIDDSVSLPFFKESQLDQLIEAWPALIPGVDNHSTAVVGQMHVRKAGQADLVLVDAKGEITVVESKLVANPEYRHRVIAQLFSYAAGLWRLPYEKFEREFSEAAAVQAVDQRAPHGVPAGGSSDPVDSRGAPFRHGQVDSASEAADV